MHTGRLEVVCKSIELDDVILMYKYGVVTGPGNWADLVDLSGMSLYINLYVKIPRVFSLSEGRTGYIYPVPGTVTQE